MAAGLMPPETGSEFSPCPKGDCKHVDCAATHERARRVCKYCLRPIGWDVRFYDVRDAQGDEPGDKDHSVHAVCEEVEIEREQSHLRITPRDL